MRRQGGAICTAVYTTRSPKEKGTPMSIPIYSKTKLIEAKCGCDRVGYVPSLFFNYTIPVPLCYNHKNLSATLSLALDVVSRLALYNGVGSLSHSKRKCISIHVFSLRGQG